MLTVLVAHKYIKLNFNVWQSIVDTGGDETKSLVLMCITCYSLQQYELITEYPKPKLRWINFNTRQLITLAGLYKYQLLVLPNLWLSRTACVLW